MVEVTESFLLTVIAGGFAFLGAFLMCLLRSRCTTVKCCCVQCDRDVLPPDTVEALQQNVS